MSRTKNEIVREYDKNSETEPNTIFINVRVHDIVDTEMRLRRSYTVV